MSVSDSIDFSRLNHGFITCSKVLAKIPNLDILLAAPVSYQQSLLRPQREKVQVLAWGRKDSASEAEQYAQKYGVGLVRLEDGFVRSVELGSVSPPLSIVIDDIGIYYDATRPSKLEALIKSSLNHVELTRAQNLIKLWQQQRISKYNHSRELDFASQSLIRDPFVLVIDQTFGDASIAYGQANTNSFQQMLDSALEYDPKCFVVVKIHPDVFSGKKRGHFSQGQFNHPRIIVLTDDVHIASLLEKATAVFCVTSQVGFEALLWQKPVFTFGMPFYAGWGLTNDALIAPTRRVSVGIENLVYASLIAYPRYVHPETGHQCEVEEFVLWMGLQRKQRERLPANLIVVKPSRWKRSIYRQFSQGSKLKFLKNLTEASSSETVLTWGVKESESPWPSVRVEDGFLRSVGLGADLTKPFSWVFDPVGMYYDATRPSALEQILLNGDFSSEMCERAKNLQSQILLQQITKYNIGTRDWHKPSSLKENQKVILIPGQVESDASIRLGSPEIKTNFELIQAVRAAEPNAYLIYKPHPDVLAGLRKAGRADYEHSAIYDELVTHQDMAWLISQVDEVHTLTSLAGFEALMRGKTVVCYGQPFYSGWGLTKDVNPNPRRGRQLQLSELIAATLILYPTYISRKTGYYTTPEQVIAELVQMRDEKGENQPWWRLLLRKLLAFKRF